MCILYVIVSGRIGEDCRYDYQCYGVAHSTCLGGYCKCERGYRMKWDKTRCLMKLIGEGCQDPIDCRVPGSLCSQEKKCACALGRYANKSRDFCVWRRVYDWCTIDEDCSSSMKESYCVIDWCLCKSGTIPSENNADCVPHPDADDIGRIIIYIVTIAFLIIVNFMLVAFFYHYIHSKT